MKKLNVIQMILDNVEEEAKQEAEKPITKGVYRASEIGGCPRAIQYNRLKYKPEPMTPETHLIFKDGHIHHNAVRELLGKVGTLSSVETTISKRYMRSKEKFVITGTIDGIFNGRVFDVKSMSTFRFKYLDRDFPSEYLNYVYQLMVYMDILSITEGFFIFKDKNSGELKVKTVQYNPSTLNTILDRIVAVHIGVKTKKLLARPYGRDTWHCKLCQYRLACWRLPMEVRHWGGTGSGKAQEQAKNARERQKIRALKETLKEPD